MVQLHYDLCNFLRALNNQFDTFTNGMIIVKKGLLKGLTFKINSLEGYVRVNRHFDINFDVQQTSISNLLHYLHQHKIITTTDLSTIRPGAIR